MAIEPPSTEGSSFPERLPAEVEAWQKEGLIRPEQAQMILARYGLAGAETPRSLQHSRIVGILAVLGAILVGVGVILVIGANWEAIPRFARLTLLIVATGASYHVGYRLAHGGGSYPKVGTAVLLLGSLLWAASIFLIGQMYNLGGGGGEARGVLYWFIGVLPLAYILTSWLYLALALALGTTWLLMIAEKTWPLEQAVFLFALAIGAFLYSAGNLHSAGRNTRKLEPVFHWFGLIYIFAALYAFSFQGWWRWYHYRETGGLATISYSDPSFLYSDPWFLTAIAAGAVCAIAYLLTSSRRDAAVKYEAPVLLVLIALCAAVPAVLQSIPPVHTGYSYGYQPSGGAAGVAILFNLILFAAEIGMIALGWFRNQPGLCNFGIFIFFVHVVTRYFDVFGGMLGSGAVFIGAGILLLLGGLVLERSRRRLLDSMSQRRS